VRGLPEGQAREASKAFEEIQEIPLHGIKSDANMGEFAKECGIPLANIDATFSGHDELAERQAAALPGAAALAATLMGEDSSQGRSLTLPEVAPLSMGLETAGGDVQGGPTAPPSNAHASRTAGVVAGHSGARRTGQRLPREAPLLHEGPNGIHTLVPDHEDVGAAPPSQPPAPRPHPGAGPAAGAAASAAEEGFPECQPHEAASSYSLSPVQRIQQDIIQYGPVSAVLTVYSDFLAHTAFYQSGVYKHVTGSLQGRYPVKIWGWDSECGQDYWRVANCWDDQRGVSGTFKIARGSDECGIESQLWLRGDLQEDPLFPGRTRTKSQEMPARYASSAAMPAVRQLPSAARPPLNY